MRNLFKGFKLFEDEDKDSYVDTIKKQLGVEKKIWTGMPLLVSNAKLGTHKITQPTIFYVWEFDDNSVTLRNIPKPTEPDDGEEDGDGEINIDDSDVHGTIEVTIDIKDFYDLQKPQGMQPGGSAAMGMGGGLF